MSVIILPENLAATAHMTPVEILARTIWGEARGEGNAGMKAIANVVMNRVAHPRWWGDDVKSVCLGKEQFSCWNPGDPNRAKLLVVGPTDDTQYSAALALAKLAVAGSLPDITRGANSYYSLTAKPPPWTYNHEPVFTYRHHVFFII